MKARRSRLITKSGSARSRILFARPEFLYQRPAGVPVAGDLPPWVRMFKPARRRSANKISSSPERRIAAGKRRWRRTVGGTALAAPALRRIRRGRRVVANHQEGN